MEREGHPTDMGGTRCSDLYDLRLVWSFNRVAPCLVQSSGVAFMVLAGFYTVFPKMPVRGLSAAGQPR